MDRSLQQIDAADVRTSRQQRLADIQKRIAEPSGIGPLRRALAELCELLKEAEHV